MFIVSRLRKLASYRKVLVFSLGILVIKNTLLFASSNLYSHVFIASKKQPTKGPYEGKKIKEIKDPIAQQDTSSGYTSVAPQQSSYAQTAPLYYSKAVVITPRPTLIPTPISAITQAPTNAPQPTSAPAQSKPAPTPIQSVPTTMPTVLPTAIPFTPVPTSAPITQPTAAPTQPQQLPNPSPVN
jgi:hypothetical protein